MIIRIMRAILVVYHDGIVTNTQYVDHIYANWYNIVVTNWTIKNVLVKRASGETIMTHVVTSHASNHNGNVRRLKCCVRKNNGHNSAIFAHNHGTINDNTFDEDI